MKTIFICFTIWVLSALLNVVFAGTLMFFLSAFQNSYAGVCFIVFIATLLFSIPGMFIFFIVFIFKRNKLLLFRLLLRAGFCISGLSSLVFFFISADIVNGQPLLFALSVVVSFVIAIMAHHTIINSITHR